MCPRVWVGSTWPQETLTRPHKTGTFNIVQAMRPHERRPDGAATARGPPSSACTGTRRRAPRARPNGARQRCAGAASVRPSAAGWCRTPRSEQSMPSRHSVDDVGGSCCCCCCCPPALARSSLRPFRARRLRLWRCCSVRGGRRRFPRSWGRAWGANAPRWRAEAAASRGNMGAPERLARRADAPNRLHRSYEEARTWRARRQGDPMPSRVF